MKKLKRYVVNGRPATCVKTITLHLVQFDDEQPVAQPVSSGGHDEPDDDDHPIHAYADLEGWDLGPIHDLDSLGPIPEQDQPER